MTLKLNWLQDGVGFIKMFPKKSALFVIGTVALICGLSITAQLLYPHNRSLPNTKIVNADLSMKNEKQIELALNKLDSKLFVLKLANKSYHLTPKSTGLTFATTQ